MQKHGNILFGAFAALTLFLSLQPALLFAALIDTSNDADGGISGLELRSSSFVNKRLATKDVLPHYLDTDDASQDCWSHLHLFSIYLDDNIADTDVAATPNTHNIRAPPVLSFC